MGGAVGIISTIASVASSFAHRQQRSSGTSASEALAQREAKVRTQAEERRKRLAEQRADAAERKQLQQQKRGKLSATVATTGAGLLGQADVGKTTLKAKLGE